MCTLPNLQRYDFLEILEIEKRHKKIKAEAIELLIADDSTPLPVESY